MASQKRRFSVGSAITIRYYHDHYSNSCCYYQLQPASSDVYLRVLFRGLRDHWTADLAKPQPQDGAAAVLQLSSGEGKNKEDVAALWGQNLRSLSVLKGFVTVPFRYEWF